ncbi:MAG: polymerase primary sigma factor, partial [Sphingomonadales bacterium]|nr:polymerase primary sigma factor [Sphingomonadales bacterium]
MAKNETQEIDTADEGDAPLLDLNEASIKKMMQRAQKRGTVTIDEINAAIPADQNELIEDIMSQLSERGVTVVENDEASDDDEEEDKEAEPAIEDEVDPLDDGGP